MFEGRRLCVSAATLCWLSGHALGQDFPQAFDDVEALVSGGRWFAKNNSSPIGIIGYFQGDAGTFAAHATAGYLAANFESAGAAVATISNWFVTPALNLENGQQFSFFTRTVQGSAFADRLQVRLSTNGFSTDVGGSEVSVGDFSTLLLDVNPTYDINGVGYPEAWTEFIVTVSGLAEPAVGRLAFRYFVEDGGPQGARSNYIGIDSVTYSGTVAADPVGACCLPSGVCVAGRTAAQCTKAGGVYGGDGSACGACPVFGHVETVDAGDLPGTASVLSGSGNLSVIAGSLAFDDVDMFRLRVCDRLGFGATTHGGPAIDSMVFLFNLDGTGITKDDESGASLNHAKVTGQFVAAEGEVYLAVSSFDRDAVDGSGQRLWNETNPGGGYEPEWAPNGPGAASALAGWTTFFPTVQGPYVISLTGACFISPPCFANCDGSTGTPALTANDFQCFINEYSSGSSYANCDGSTGTPALTANDFQCFINVFAAGCS